MFHRGEHAHDVNTIFNLCRFSYVLLARKKRVIYRKRNQECNVGNEENCNISVRAPVNDRPMRGDKGLDSISVQPGTPLFGMYTEIISIHLIIFS